MYVLYCKSIVILLFLNKLVKAFKFFIGIQGCYPFDHHVVFFVLGDDS